MSAPASRHDEAAAALADVYALLAAIGRRARDEQVQGGASEPGVPAPAESDDTLVETRR
jgi:hypothetical protein